MVSPGEASTQTEPHVTPAELASLAAGELAAEARMRIEVHLERCGACRVQVEGAAPPSTQPDTAPAPLPPTPYRARVLGTFNERYELKRLLGAGGMGAVYEALDTRLHRHVALKLLRLEPEDPIERDAAATRLVREARAMAALSHRHVVTVYDVGTHDGQVFVAMQLVHGTTLRRWLEDRTRSVAEIARVLREAGSGLAAAHSAGLIHRDFKPDNVLISRRGTARVTDFGLARRTDIAEVQTHDQRSSAPRVIEQDIPSTVTRSGAIIGTPAYMAPEQFQGEPCDARADQFSFCVTAWEALFGARPFAGTTWSEIYANTISGKLTEPADERRVPRHVTRVLRRGLSVDPAERHTSLVEVLRVLDTLLVGGSAPRRFAQWAAVFAAGAAAATAVVYVVLQQPTAAPAGPTVAAPPPPVVTTPMVTPIDPAPTTEVSPASTTTRPATPTDAPSAVDPTPTIRRADGPARSRRPPPGESVASKGSAAAAPTAAEVSGSGSGSGARPAESAPDPREAALATLRAERATLVADVRTRGLLASDLPGAYHSELAAADEALALGAVDTARSALGRARTIAASIVIDADFVDRKLQRINEKLTRLPESQRAELAALYKDVVSAWKRGDARRANASLNEIASKLQLSR